MLSKNNIFTIFILLLIGFSACEKTEKIDDFPLRPPKLVVNCYFEENGQWEFQVSKSLSVLDNAELKYINNATIKLFDESVLLATITEQDDNNLYSITDNLPQVGHSYSIEVTSPDFNATLKANDIVPVTVPINNVELEITDSTFYEYEYPDEFGNIIIESGGEIKANLTITINDPAEAENYYQVRVYKVDTFDYFEYNNGIEESAIYITSNNVAIEDNSDDYGNQSLFFKDELFNGESLKLELKFNDWTNSKSNYYFVELSSMSKAGYLYRKTVRNFNNSNGDMFAEPVQVYSNIENGFGIFAGVSTYKDSILFEH